MKYDIPPYNKAGIKNNGNDIGCIRLGIKRRTWDKTLRAKKITEIVLRMWALPIEYIQTVDLAEAELNFCVLSELR